MTLYHVTPSFNAESIRQVGVDPFRSRGKRPVSWWVDERALMWALAHCSARHKVPVCDLIVFEVPLSAGVWGATRWTGVHTQASIVFPEIKHRAVTLVERHRIFSDVRDIPF